MATYRKRNDKSQARVQRAGQSSIAKSFRSKADDIKWARHAESQLYLGVLAPKLVMPQLKTVMKRYVEEVTPTNKGESQERYRSRHFLKGKLGGMAIDKISSEVVAQYREERVKQVSNNTVRLELAFLSVVFEQCFKDWGLAVL